MISTKMLKAAVGGLVVLCSMTETADACSCPRIYFTPCDYVTGFAEADLVVRATALSRSDQADINDPVTYTVEVTTVFDGDTGGEDQISFVTGGNEAICGVNLVIGVEYILGLSLQAANPFDPTITEETLTVGSCGLARSWKLGISDEEKADLEAGCSVEDPCQSACDQYQECVQYENNGRYYCSDTCDNFPCSGECTTRPRKWCRDKGFEGCPEKRRCDHTHTKIAMMSTKILKAAVGAMVVLGNITETDACTCLAVYFTPCDYVTGFSSAETNLVVRATALSRSDQADINDPVTYTVDVTTVFQGDTGGEDQISFVTGGNEAICGVTLEIGEEYILGLSLRAGDPFDPTITEETLTVGLCGLARRWSDQVFDDEKADLEAGCSVDDPCQSACDEYQECVQYTRNGKYYCSDTCDSFPCSGECTTRPRKWCRSSGFEGCPEKRRCA
eukprot:g13075.t1